MNVNNNIHVERSSIVKFFDLVRVYLMATVKKCLGTSNYYSFKGRTSRTEFCYFFLFVFLCLLVASFVGLFWFVALVLASPAAAVCVRRFHDLNNSPWFTLGVPLVGVFPVKYSFFYLCTRKSIEEDNVHGSKPSEIFPDVDINRKLSAESKLSPLAAGGISLGALISSFFIILILMSLTASGGKSGPDELSDYINESLPALSKQEAIVQKQLKKLIDSSDADLDDDKTYYALVDIADETIDESRKLVALADSIEPTDPKIREVHQKNIQFVELQHQSIVTMMESIDSDDYAILTDTTQMASQARAAARNFRHSLETLALEYDVELKKK